MLDIVLNPILEACGFYVGKDSISYYIRREPDVTIFVDYWSDRIYDGEWEDEQQEISVQR